MSQDVESAILSPLCQLAAGPRRSSRISVADAVQIILAQSLKLASLRLAPVIAWPLCTAEGALHALVGKWGQSKEFETRTLFEWPTGDGQQFLEGANLALCDCGL